MRFGVRLVVLVSVAGLFLSCLAYLLPSTLTSIIIIRVVHGVFFGLSQTALASAALGGPPASRRGEASGWFMLGLTLATGFAPFAALTLVNSGPGQIVVFVVSAVWSVRARLPAHRRASRTGAIGAAARLTRCEFRC